MLVSVTAIEGKKIFICEQQSNQDRHWCSINIPSLVSYRLADAKMERIKFFSVNLEDLDKPFSLKRS